MIKNLSLAAITVILTVSLVTMMSCGDSKKDNNTTSGKSSDLVTKDDKGQNKPGCKPQENDTLRYKMVAKSTETENGATDNGGR